MEPDRKFVNTTPNLVPVLNAFLEIQIPKIGTTTHHAVGTRPTDPPPD